MHWNSLYMMTEFAKNHLDSEKELKILDLGSKEVVDSGTYKPIFDNPKWTYHGCDIEEGTNVDIVMSDKYVIPVEDESYDVVISGQAFEHIEFFWVTAKEIARIIKPGGVVCIIVPSTGQVHRFPIDCWRFYEDGMRAIANWMGFETIEARVDDQSCWNDVILIAKKP